MQASVDFDELSAAFAESRTHLARVVDRMKAAIDAINRDNMDDLRTTLREAADAHDALRRAIDSHPERFERPRTVTLHGIKFGMQKGKGRVEILDANRTVALIRKHFPERVDELIEVFHVPRKDAIGLLPAADVKRIGASVAGADDQIVIRPADSAVDKAVAALIKLATLGDE